MAQMKVFVSHSHTNNEFCAGTGAGPEGGGRGRRVRGPESAQRAIGARHPARAARAARLPRRALARRAALALGGGRDTLGLRTLRRDPARITCGAGRGAARRERPLALPVRNSSASKHLAFDPSPADRDDLPHPPRVATDDVPARRRNPPRHSPPRAPTISWHAARRCSPKNAIPRPCACSDE